MRTLSLWMQMSLDGYTEGPNGELGRPRLGPQLHGYVVDELRQMGTFLYGRKVYQMMAAYWPTADTDPSSNVYQVAYAKVWKQMPKVVFSRTLADAGWNTSVIADDMAVAVTKLKEQPGGPLVFLGGARTAAQLVRSDLIDAYRIFVHPVVLGGGTRLFPDAAARAGLRLVETCEFDSAVVQLHYRHV